MNLVLLIGPAEQHARSEGDERYFGCLRVSRTRKVKTGKVVEQDRLLNSFPNGCPFRSEMRHNSECTCTEVMIWLLPPFYLWHETDSDCNCNGVVCLSSENALLPTTYNGDWRREGGMGGSKVEEASFSGESRTTGGEQGWEIQRGRERSTASPSAPACSSQGGCAVARAQTGMVAETKREGEVPAHALLVEQVVRLSLSLSSGQRRRRRH